GRLRGALLFLHARRLAAQVAQEVQLRTADLRTAHDVDLVDDRRMQRENALDTLAERHLAHREGGARAAAVLADHQAFEHLDAFLLALAHLHVDADGIAGPHGGTGLQVWLLHGFNRLHHSLLLTRGRTRRSAPTATSF